MCSGGGSSANQQRQIDAQNEIQRQQFEAQQRLAEQQFAFQQGNAADSLALQREIAAQSHAAAEASFHLQAGEIARQVQREAEREAKIQSGISSVNQAFNGRGSIFNDLEKDTFNLNRDQLKETRDDGRRNLAFALARAGRRFDTLGIDKGQEINDRYNDGLIDAKTFAAGVSDNARSADQSLRQNLLASASSGAFDGQQLVSGASGALQAIADTQGGLSASAADKSYFNDIPNSINQLAGVFSGGGQSGGVGNNQFRPTSRSSGRSGRVSSVGV